MKDIGDWTEDEFEALVTLHMLKPGHVLTAEDCQAIEYTRLDADKVQNNAVDAFDEGRKHGIASVLGKTDAAMFEEIGRLQNELAVERAMNRFWRKAEVTGDLAPSTVGKSPLEGDLNPNPPVNP